MWKTIKSNEKFRCLNTKTGDTTDQAWESESEALAWASESNEKMAQFVAANKLQAAQRKAAAVGKITAADMLIDKKAH